MTKGNNSSRSAINTTMVNNSPLQHKYCHCIYDQRHNLQPIGSVLHRRRLTTLLTWCFDSAPQPIMDVLSWASSHRRALALGGTWALIIYRNCCHHYQLLPTTTNIITIATYIIAVHNTNTTHTITNTRVTRTTTIIITTDTKTIKDTTIALNTSYHHYKSNTIINTTLYQYPHQHQHFEK